MGDLSGRYAALTERLVESVLTRTGHTASELRRATLARASRLVLTPGGEDVPPALTAYVDKVALHAHTVTDADVVALQRAGNSDDALFEVTVAAAPVDPKVRATLGFLARLTLAPADVRPADLQPLRAAGVSDAAAEDAIQVCVLFNIYDRLADSLSFYLPGPDGYAASGRSLMRRGYLL